MSAQAARRDEIARGQTEFPEEILEDIPDTRLERANQALFEADAELEGAFTRGRPAARFGTSEFAEAAAERQRLASEGTPFVPVRARQSAARAARRQARAEVKAAEEELQSVSVGEVIEEGGIKSLLARFRVAINHPERALEWEKDVGVQRGERGRRAAAGQDLLDDLLKEGVPAEEALAQSGGPLIGPLPKVGTDAFDEFKVPYVREALFQEIATTTKLRFFERKGAETALKRLLEDGRIPQEPGSQGGSSLTLLQKIFGEELVGTLNQGFKLEEVTEAEVRGGLGLTRFQGARRGDPGFPSTQEFGDASLFGPLEGPGRTQDRGIQRFGQPVERLFPDEAPQLLETPQTPLRAEPPVLRSQVNRLKQRLYSPPNLFRTHN